VDRTAELGLAFTHRNGMTGELFFSEMVGSGIALLDYDNDGDLDLYVVQGGALGSPSAGTLATDRLFRNDLDPTGADRVERLHFTDVTAESGIVGDGYGMGAAVGDVNNDGWPDLYLTCFGGNQLWLNQGDGTFSNVTAESGADDDRWTTSATFVDLDRDGRLDLYLVNYTDFSLTNHRSCVGSDGAPDYCGPRTYRPEADRLLLNRGDAVGLRFLDVSEALGLNAAEGPGLGVVVLDVDADGWQDVYVTNDQEPNHLWMSRGLGDDGLPILEEEGLVRGVAVDSLGRPQASMGVEAGDVDGDGDTDLFMTHLQGETNTLYTNDGQGMFLERTTRAGLAVDSIAMTGFGTALFDLDNDGWLDLAAVNGEVRIIAAQRAAGLDLPLRQPNQLFRNLGGVFSNWTAAAPALGREAVSRGLAVGDLDNDGDSDLVVSNNNGPLEVLINEVGSRAHWLGLRLVTREGRTALGAEVRLYRQGQPVLLRTVRRSGSYLSSSDPRVLFGLGDHDAIDRVEVRWPDGERESYTQLVAGQYHELKQGAQASSR